jgi:DNA-binding LacI/PurR family transcriptional regulator/DNA-binding transcriptional regulator YhcF (GntR family)
MKSTASLTPPASASVPEYLRIKRQLVSEIKGGRWAVGSAISSETELTAVFKVSRATVVRSLQELVLEGYLYRQKGRGTFVADFRPTEHRAPLPLFISEFTWRMSGSGRQVLLRILSAIEEALGPTHPGVQIRQAPNDQLDDFTRRYIDEKRPPVALIMEQSFNPEILAYLQRKNCVTWVINEPVDTSNCVYMNQERAGYLATMHLINQGRQSIALLNGPLNAYWGFAARLRGYQKALEESGLKFDPQLHRQGDHAIDSEAGRAMLRAILDEGKTIDGVVGVSDSKAMGAMALADERGIDVGRELAFVSIDNIIADRSIKPLSSVALPFEEMGRQVAQSAVSSANPDSHHHSTVLQQVCLQPYLVLRDETSQTINQRPKGIPVTGPSGNPCS